MDAATISIVIILGLLLYMVLGFFVSIIIDAISDTVAWACLFFWPIVIVMYSANNLVKTIKMIVGGYV